MRSLYCFLAVVLSLGTLAADEALPTVFKDDFESGVKNWKPSDVKKWKVTEENGNHVYHLLGKSDYQPPHRSPHSLSLVKDVVVSDFVFSAKVKTLQSSRAHRDMCLFFGYQDPANFYYVHLGEKTDPHANQIFIVNDAPRIKISEKTNDGTPWKDEAWHQVKVVRRVSDGLIEIYFDNMEQPQMVAHDKTFTWGQVGLGSFDDLGQWDDVQLQGKIVTPPKQP
ncbi:hypothetical protein [Thalassoglobus polymorphus]|uniref:Laminin G domain protein n=1 Tax=Thalassoglobus polymorphus TaxID=2527994 RepID=A0A517QTD9_9PLAN|nr:hypothetical protein [Thalassoglobus polymorphus]QDT34911.1 hypothetical protein Mal48_41840 [Thalassoglobus polymorphus]